jgi:hypothetical protein
MAQLEMDQRSSLVVLAQRVAVPVQPLEVVLAQGRPVVLAQGLLLAQGHYLHNRLTTRQQVLTIVALRDSCLKNGLLVAALRHHTCLQGAQVLL